MKHRASTVETATEPLESKTKKWNTIEIPSATLWCNMWNKHILTETSRNHKICRLDLASYSSLVVWSRLNVDEWQRWGGGRWRRQQHKELRQPMIANRGGRTAPQRLRDMACGSHDPINNGTMYLRWCEASSLKKIFLFTIYILDYNYCYFIFNFLT
jgi:hypothetical protein